MSWSSRREMRVMSVRMMDMEEDIRSLKAQIKNMELQKHCRKLCCNRIANTKKRVHGLKRLGKTPNNSTHGNLKSTRNRSVTPKKSSLGKIHMYPDKKTPKYVQSTLYEMTEMSSSSDEDYKTVILANDDAVTRKGIFLSFESNGQAGVSKSDYWNSSSPTSLKIKSLSSLKPPPKCQRKLDYAQTDKVKEWQMRNFNISCYDGVSCTNGKSSSVSVADFSRTAQQSSFKIFGGQNKLSAQSKATVNNTGKFPCKFCRDTFDSLALLFAHMRFHTGLKPFSCLICSNSFLTANNLKRHAEKNHKTDSLKKLTCVV